MRLALWAFVSILFVFTASDVRGYAVDTPSRRLSEIGTRHPRFEGEFYGWLSNESFLLARPDHDHPRGVLFQRQLASGEEKPLDKLTKMYNEADGGSILQISPDGQWVLWWTGKICKVQIFGAKLDGSEHFQIPKAKADTDNLDLFWLADSRRFVELAMPHGTKFTNAIVRSVDKPDVARITPIPDASPLQAVCAIAGRDVAVAAGDRLIALPCSLHGYGSLEANPVIGESTVIVAQPGADRTTPLVLPPKSDMVCGAALSPRSDRIAWLIEAKSDDNNTTVGLWLSKLDGSDWVKIGEEETVEPDMGFGDHLEKFMISAPGSPQWLPDGKTISFFYRGELYTVPQKTDARAR